MMEKLNILAYLVENGYTLPLPMDEMAARHTEAELWELVQELMEDDQ